MTSNKLDIEQFIVDCIETYCMHRNIDRTIVNTIFDGLIKPEYILAWCKFEEYKL